MLFSSERTRKSKNLEIGKKRTDHLKKKQEAIAELTFASQFNPAFEEQFIIFRYLKMSEDYEDVGEGNAGGEEMDVVAKFAYESSLR